MPPLSPIAQQMQMLGQNLLQPVADKSNPLQHQLNPLAGTEGARGGGTGRAGAILQPDGWYTHPDYPGTSFQSPEDVPAYSGPVLNEAELQSIRTSSDRSLEEAAKRGGRFDKRIETLETNPDIFVHLKPGHELPGGDTAFGADSLKEVREMMKTVIKSSK